MSYFITKPQKVIQIHFFSPHSGEFLLYVIPFATVSISAPQLYCVIGKVCLMGFHYNGTIRETAFATLDEQMSQVLLQCHKKNAGGSYFTTQVVFPPPWSLGRMERARGWRVYFQFFF
jgi:hypothetical protein